MTRARTTEIKFDDGSGYFVSLTDAPGVRIGLKYVRFFDIPLGHAFYDRVVESTTLAEVEGHFDELMGAAGF